MRGCFALLFAWTALAPAASAAADPSPTAQDPYAGEPYWYQPGHPVDPADAASISTAPGFVAERVLTVPREFGSWTALTVDARGRLIATAQERSGLFRLTPPSAGQTETKVEVLQGAASVVGWAQGVLYAFDSLYVTVAEENPHARPGVYRLQDTDGDDHYDRHTLLLPLDGTGEHGPHNLVVGPEGRSLYLMCGNGTRVPDDLTRRLPTATTGIDHLMSPGFASSTHSSQGWVVRFAPDGSERTLICAGLRNPYDLAFNADGDLFTFDSDAEWDLGTPWYRPTRISHLVPGGEYGWRADAAVWPEHYEDSVGPVLNIGPGSPTGVAFGTGTRFPTRYQRAFFACDWTFGTIHAVWLERSGAGYTARVEEFLGGAGLPVTDAVVGADGALYFVVGGRRLGSAVYRVHYTGEEATTTVAHSDPLPPLHRLRRQLERQLEGAAPELHDDQWSLLGHADRRIRFAARVLLEKAPLAAWRERALAETDRSTQLTALLALARHGTAADLTAVLERCAQLPWDELADEEQLRVLRLAELVLARRPAEAPRADHLARRWAAAFPDAHPQVNRELARVLGAMREPAVLDDMLRLMGTDRGQTSAEGLTYFTRNPKYGQAVRDMLQAAPLLERMHQAQMMLWLADRWTDEHRRRYFELIGDALAFSKGGHSYADFWSRIRDTALERAPADQRDMLTALSAPPAISGEAVLAPAGPGQDWTVTAALEAAAGPWQGRDFARGRAMFSATGCVSCHRLGATGGNLGPDLSAVGQRFPLRDLLEAILEPNRAISDQYQMVILQTSDGRSLSGRILSRDADATYLATNLMRPSQTERIPQPSIVHEQTLPVSTMPEDLVNGLNEEELLDLLAYLVSGGDSGHPAFQAR